MDDQALGAEQARLLRQAIDQAGLDLNEVWLRYFSFGGDAGITEMAAYLQHLLPLPPLQRDLLAHAVNELADHRPTPRAPYTSDLRNAPGADPMSRT